VSVVTYTSTRLSSVSTAAASSPGVCMRPGYYGGSMSVPDPVSVGFERHTGELTVTAHHPPR
jgi:hypothetical protein